ncbi:YhfC family glutamic-type intramembrane protease, partial [Burkholderia pseudomallei]
QDARNLGLRSLPNRNGPSHRDARRLANGIGHGGAQAWFLGVVVLAQWVYLACLAYRGELNDQRQTMPADLALRIQLM